MTELEKAAQDWVLRYYDEPDIDAAIAFKAGAEWQRQQSEQEQEEASEAGVRMPTFKRGDAHISVRILPSNGRTPKEHLE